MTRSILISPLYHLFPPDFHKINIVKLQDEYCTINRGDTVKLTDQYSISPLYHLFPLDFHKMNTVKLTGEIL